MLESDRTINAERIGDEHRILAAVADDVAQELAPRLATQRLAGAQKAGQPGKPQQTRERQARDCRNRADQVQPTRLADEVLTARPRDCQVVGEVDEEDDAREIVIAAARNRVSSSIGSSCKTIISSENSVRTRMKIS